ncbi:PPC domain-containing protein [Geitlerinema sp. PCC 9228]|jgi:hypothetical protein|uniref:PPC domain-containing protein n=1 Tax=Geitlerinema sp. PCC 9228 TaxID=111611 RepID=UPI0008F9A591|nr:PPC domain-containing protein [Geitlerinema sp. PCC 9228]
MRKSDFHPFHFHLSRLALFLPATALMLGSHFARANAQEVLYDPVELPDNNQVTDTLSAEDIPTGQGGFARDYVVELEADDHILIELSSDSFDPIVSLIAADGSTIAENDDGPDGGTDSVLFARISEAGRYIVRVRSFGETGMGDFQLKLTRLQPVDN